MTPAVDAPVLRRTRRRLIAWSAGSTLVVLLILGFAIYAATATSLAAGGTAQLQARIDLLAGGGFPVQTGPATPTIGVTLDPRQQGLVIGGDASGTIGLAVEPGSDGLIPTGMAGVGIVEGGPVLDPVVLDADQQAAVEAGRTIVLETTFASAPVRVMVASVPALDGPATVMVIGDRTAELDTLRTLVLVLLGGGLAVLAASVAVGYVYAGRALVPIRESLRRQREFTADASHELRTPLAITRAAITELRRGRDDPAAVDRALDDMEAGTSRLEQLVGDLLLLARADAETVELAVADTDLALAAAEAGEMLEAVASGRGVRIALDVEPAPLQGDEDRLRQLTAILVDNAIRHAPAGSRVLVSVRPGATLTVEDEGPGIRPDDLDHVFERFWRAQDAPPGGTGLGLAIASWIVERHGGSIRAGNREPGPGARFIVRIPAG
jgi:signal transduction histidine kinase